MGPVSNMANRKTFFSTFEKVEELKGSATHGVTRLYLGLEPGSIFCFIDLSAQGSSIEEGGRVSLGTN